MKEPNTENDCRYVREKVFLEEITTDFVNSSDQLANMFTKSLRGVEYILTNLVHKTYMLHLERECFNVISHLLLQICQSLAMTYSRKLGSLILDYQVRFIVFDSLNWCKYMLCGLHLTHNIQITFSFYRLGASMIMVVELKQACGYIQNFTTQK